MKISEAKEAQDLLVKLSVCDRDLKTLEEIKEIEKLQLYSKSLSSGHLLFTKDILKEVYATLKAAKQDEIEEITNKILLM